MTDLEIKKNVEAELNWEPSVNAAQIGVAVKDGVVTLSGRVDSYWEKVTAERAAARVEGVRAVANELEIHLPFSSERTDEDIARAAGEPTGVVRFRAQRPHQGQSIEGLDHAGG